MQHTSPPIAAQPIAQRDWADDMADTIIDQFTFVRDRHAWLAIHLRIVKQEGRIEGVSRAGQAVQDAFDSHRARSA